jgi:hypothetical protein
VVTQCLTGSVRGPSTYYQRDWFLACQDARSFCSTPVAWLLDGELDPEALNLALESLTLRHDALRTAFRARGDDVDQMVWPRVDIDVATVDLSLGPDPAAAARERIVAEAERPRVLDAAPLWHGLLLRLSPRRHVLALFIHHLVFDGWSHGVLHDELVRCYRAAESGRPPRLPQLPLQLADFARWERSHRDPPAEAWWRDRLTSLPPLSALPPAGGRFVSHAISSPPRSATSALAELARAEGVAAGPAFLAVVIAARRHLVGDDVVIGVTRAGRERPELRRVVGPLLDHAPVRVDLSGRPTFRALLHRVHGAYRDAMAHKLPLGMIRQVVPDSVAARGGRLHDTRYNYLPFAPASAAVAAAGQGGLRITDWPIDPTHLAPRHTEDHPEVLPLSYLVRYQRDGDLGGEVCAHDRLYSAAQLTELAESFTATVPRVIGDAADRPLHAPNGSARNGTW